MRHAILVLLSLVSSVSPLTEALGQDEQETKSETLTLERLFPEKRFFGPSPRSMSFSHSGRYGAWLWRPWLERRHGSDLWVHDFETGETRRLTSASIFADHQESARKVVEDREKKAKARKKKKEKGDATHETEQGSEEGGDDGPPAGGLAGDDSEHETEVDEDDADDKDAPRHAGVSSFTFSPQAEELLLVSGGDIYRMQLEGAVLDRQTRTRESEGRPSYLPDGSGYLYRRDEALLRVSFGSHLVEQLDPELEDGQRLSSWSISDDGTKLALVGSTGRRFGESSRKVNIADYDGRFMKVKEVSRHVSDDPYVEYDSTYYVYVLPTPMREDGTLYKLHEFHHGGPRDVVRSPDWAPDSSRVCFATYQQKTSQVEVLEVLLPSESDDEGEGEAASTGSWDALVDAAKTKNDDEKADADDSDEESEEPSKTRELPAKVVYRFLHAGGPNTPRMVLPRYVDDSRRIVFVTEQSGFRHLSILNPVYEHLEPLTRGPYEVYLSELPRHRRWIYVTATKERPNCLDVYKVDLEGDMTRLTPKAGRFDSAAVSPDGAHVLARFSAYGRLPELVAIDSAEASLEELTQSHPDEARELTSTTPEFFSFENRHGHRIHGMVMKPADLAEGERRPGLIYVYGGPLGSRKEIQEGNYSGSGYLFARYMTEVHGFVTATIDPRGMSGYGAVFEKASFEQVGKPQAEDLVDGARFLAREHSVDPDRIGLHGWSFGGFQTQMCMYTHPEVFACGIAGAGPTEWENYNSWYSTGTIGESRQGEPDLEKYSLLPLAKNLKHRLLLVHGMEDSNVLYQDTVRVYAALLEAGKETLVELFLDPSGGHGLGGHVKSLGRYRKYEEFLLRCLTGAPAEASEPAEDTDAAQDGGGD